MFDRMDCTMVLLSLLFITPVPSAVAQQPADSGWQLMWSDEFDSGSEPQEPNSLNWGYEKGYVRNREWQYYTDRLENAFCQNGLLHIKALKHPAGTFPAGRHPNQDGSISSASLTSRNKISFRYGRLEMRARIDTRLGSWPAFWTLGASGRWPDGGECDIMEYYKDMLKFNVAWWKTGDGRSKPRWDSEIVKVSALGPEWVNDFHIWTMEWNQRQVKLYMDGVLRNTWETSEDEGDESVKGFQQPHYIILNQAIGGDSGGDASGLTYPTIYGIDWVRWYQQSDPNNSVAGSDRQPNS